MDRYKGWPYIYRHIYQHCQSDPIRDPLGILIWFDHMTFEMLKCTDQGKSLAIVRKIFQSDPRFHRIVTHGRKSRVKERLYYCFKFLMMGIVQCHYRGLIIMVVSEW